MDKNDLPMTTTTETLPLKNQNGTADNRILVVVTVDIMAWNLLRPWLDGLREAGFEVHIACSRGKYFDRLSGAGYIMHPVRLRRSFNVFAQIIPLIQLTGIIRAGRFTIVNTHSPVAAAVGRLAATLASVDHIVYTVHGFYFHDRMNPFLRNQLIALEWLFGRWTDAFMFVSDEDKRTAESLGISGSNALTMTIYNGVDPAIYRPPSPEDGLDQLLALHGISRRPVVGIVGRIVKEKGHREFLEMARALTARGFDATYLVVGDSLPSDRDQFGPEFRRLVAEANLSDRFVFTGMTDKVPQYLRLMDIFVLPSYREGFPRSILEAMSTGLPVVATDIRGCREAVVEGVTGLIVPPANSQALTGAVERLLNDTEMRQRMGAAAHSIALEKYDFHKVRRRFVTFVQRVVNEDLGAAPVSPASMKIALTLSSAAILVGLVFLTYVFPGLTEYQLSLRIHSPLIPAAVGDLVGCLMIGFLMDWRLGAILYITLFAVEATLSEKGIWGIRQLVWFTNLIPSLILISYLAPLIARARNWRRSAAR